MEPDDIKDRESLREWLAPRPRADGIAIAQRSACRVFPIFGREMSDDSAKDYSLSTLPVSRALLTAGVARGSLSEAVMDATKIALEDIAGSYSFSGRKAGPAMVVDAAAMALLSAAEGTHADDAVDLADGSVTVAAAADTYIWEQIRDDARLIEAGADPLAAPLWSIQQPDWFRQFDRETRAIWADDPPGRWSFWTRWWDGVLSGQQIDWKLQEAVALIPEEVWKAGPDAVAEAMAGIEKEREIDRVDASVETVLLNMQAGNEGDIRTVQWALVRNRAELPPTFDAVLGFIQLEIDRLQGRNHRDQDEVDEAIRQIRVLTILSVAVARLADLVPTGDTVPKPEAAEAEKLVRLYVRKFKDWPRANADELVDTSYRGALVGITAVMLPMLGVTAPYALAAGLVLFGSKNFVDALKAAKELAVPHP